MKTILFFLFYILIFSCYSQKIDPTKFIFEFNMIDSYTNKKISEINITIFQDNKLIINKIKHDTLDFSIILDKGHDYTFYMKPTSFYQSQKETISKEKLKSAGKLIFEYNIPPSTQCNLTSTNNEIYFEFNSSRIEIIGKIKIDSLIEKLFKEFPNVTLEIVGNKTPLEANSLSLDRANNVLNYIQSKGIDKAHFNIRNNENNKIEHLKSDFELMSKKEQIQIVKECQSVHFLTLSFE